MSQLRSLVTDFEPLSPILHLYSPPAPPLASSTSSTDADPHLIVLATWMNAPPKLIRLYAGWYRMHFPSSRILLVTTDIAHIFWISSGRYDRLIRPAIAVIRASLSDEHSEARGTGTQRRIVSALYSNGGAFALTSLARIYRDTYNTPLPISALVLDSAPGSGGDVPSGRRAVLASLPPVMRRWPVRYLTIALMYALFAGYWLLLRLLLRKADPITQLRADLLDDTLLVNTGKRMYVYSGEDKMVGPKAVREHAAASGKAGWEVGMEEWHGSRHVAHAAKDPDRYWRVVRETFSESLKMPE